jgi:DNA-binding LacI/PurR family transcriptional regulator
LDQVGYQPNLMARTLRSGRSGMVALVVPEIDVPYFAELTRSIVKHADLYGYTVVVDQTDGDVVREKEIVLGSGRAALFEGLILSPVSITVADLRERRSSSPVVLLGEQIVDGGFDHIMIDNVAAAYSATTHLLGLGRRRIAAVGYPRGDWDNTAKLRARGYREAHAEFGIEPASNLLVNTRNLHRADGAAAMQQLLALKEPPDALLCFNDLVALGALKVAHDRGLRVPEDVALVGFDDIEDGRYSYPALTTISPDKAQIAALAVDLLMRRLDGTDNEPAEFTANFELAVRASTVGR